MIKLEKAALKNLLKLAWWDGHNEGARHTRMVCDSAIDGFMKGFEREEEEHLMGRCPACNMPIRKAYLNIKGRDEEND